MTLNVAGLYVVVFCLVLVSFEKARLTLHCWNDDSILGAKKMFEQFCSYLCVYGCYANGNVTGLAK